MMYTKSEVRAYVYPRAPLDDHLIDLMSPHVAKWVREYDPEFAKLDPHYVENDVAIAGDWMSMVSDAADDENPGAKELLAKLETHLMKGAG